MTTTSKLEVEGMSCAGCESNVEFALIGLEGIVDVTADQTNCIVTVNHDPATIDKRAIGEAIESMGYTLAD